MYKSIVTLILFLMPIINFCQEVNPFINISTGLSYPIGKYGSSNRYVEENIVTMGYNINLGIQHLLNKEIGLILEYKNNINPINNNSYYNYTRSHLNKSSIWKWTNGEFKVNSFLTGFFLNFNINKVKIQPNLCFGYSYSISPEIVFEGSEYPDYERKLWTSFEEKKAWSPSFSVGLKTTVQLINNFYLLFDFSFFRTVPTYKNVQVVWSDNHELFWPYYESEPFLVKYDYDIDMQLVNGSIGLSYGF